MSATEAVPASISTGRWARAAHALLLAAAFCSFFSIALMQSLLALGVSAWIVARRVEPGRPLCLPLLIPFAGLLATSVLSGAIARDGESTFDALRKGILPIVFFAAIDLTAGRDRLERAGRVVVLGAALAAALGLVLAAVRGADQRTSGSLGHYMTYSGVLMMAAQVALARLLFPRERERPFVGLALLLILCALAYTRTRSAWIGCGAGALCLVCAWRPRAVLLLPVAAVLAYALAPDVVRARIRSLVDPRDATATERIYMWRSGMAMVADHPLLGVGPSNPSERYPEYQLPDDPRTEPNPPSHLHDNVLQIAAERGLIGLAFWLAIWVSFFRRAAAIHRRVAHDVLARRAVLGSIAALIAFLVMGIFEYNYGDSEVATLALFLMALPFAAQAAAQQTEESPVAGRAA